jgi:hypothetical protein
VQRHFRKTISKSALYPQPTAAIQTGMEVAPFPLHGSGRQGEVIL